MAINKTISEYITIFEQIVKLSAGHYNPDVSNTSKSVHKRSILGFFNLGLNIMTSAISGINQYRLSKHFNDLRADFVKFAEQVNLMNKNNVLIHKKFVKILKTLESGMKAYTDRLNCQVNENLARTIEHVKFIEFTTKLEKILKPLEHGTLTGKLTPHILPYDALSNILIDHQELNTTLYKQMSPAFFYKSVSLIIVDLLHSQDAFTVHYVLTIPFLTPYNTFKSYNVRQIGIALPSDNQCVMASVPDVIVQSGRQYYSLENTICKTGKIKYCYSQPVYHLPEVTCLTNYSTCKFLPVPCTPSYIFDKTGLLVRHQETILALERGTKPTIKNISPDNFSISYLPWSKYSLVRMDTQTLYSPTFISTTIEIAIPETQFNHSEIQYNKSVYADINSLIETNAKLHIAAQSSNVSLTLSYILLGLLLTIVIAIIIILGIAVYRYRNRTATANEDVPTSAQNTTPRPTTRIQPFILTS